MSAQQEYRLEAPLGSGWVLVGWIRVSEGVVVATSYRFKRFFGRLLVNVEESARQDGYRLVAVPEDASAPQCTVNSAETR